MDKSVRAYVDLDGKPHLVGRLWGTIEHAELRHVHGLMSRYWDRPMDFADGTLVYLARREFLSVTLTVDHADFATYRIAGKRQFRVLPANHP